MDNTLLAPVLAGLVHNDTKLGGIYLVVAEEKQDAKNGLCEDIQDTVKDGFRVGVDDIAALRQTPGNRVQEPQEEGQHATPHECALDGPSEGISVTAAIDGKLIGNKKEGGCAEGKVTPFVGRLRQSANQSADNHDLVRENGDQDGGPGKTGGQEEVCEKQWRRYEPVNVPDVEHLSRPSTSDGRAAWPDKLGLDRGLSKVRGHGPVGNAGDSGDSSGNVMEQAMGLRLREG